MSETPKTIGIDIGKNSFHVVGHDERGAIVLRQALGEALPDLPLSDFRVVDFLRRAYFRPIDIEMRRNERELFLRHYRGLIAELRSLQSAGVN